MTSNKIQFIFGAGLAMLLCNSCGTIFEDGEVCPNIIPPVPDEPPVYKVRFDDSRNMNFADAFASEVKSLSLYVADSQTKKIVWSYNENDVEKLQSGNYEITLPMTSGTYDFVAWCGLGLGNADEQHHSFTPTYNPTDVKSLDQLGVQLPGGVNSPWNLPLDELHNGILMSQIIPDHDTTYVVPLTRNTNYVRVILQRTDGTDLNADDFSFEITANNGLMAYDNALVHDDMRTYTEYAKRNDSSTSGGQIVIGEIATARLLKRNSNRLRAKHGNKVLLDIPLSTYALLVKGYYNETMDDQEFLDRQNDWSFIFFLNDQNQWEQSNLYINDWHVVLNNVEF